MLFIYKGEHTYLYEVGEDEKKLERHVRKERSRDVRAQVDSRIYKNKYPMKYAHYYKVIPCVGKGSNLNRGGFMTFNAIQ